MKHFTLNEIRKAATTATHGYRSAQTILKEESGRHRSFQTYDIFLSHSFSDAELILGVKKVLEGEGFSVYVDWLEDPHLDRSNVTKKTAQHIRDRMNSCNQLVYATSENAKHSKWMPWELGYFDGRKSGRVAILPLLDSEYDNFKGQEYLTLYPVIGKDTPSYMGGVSGKGLQVYDGLSTRAYTRMAA